MSNQLGTKSFATTQQEIERKRLAERVRNSPIPNHELGANLGLYIERMHLSRILLMDKLYRETLGTPGVIMEFGVRWGQNLALFSSFRGMYEPYNYTRKVIGFDTFSGFPSVSPKDVSADCENRINDYAVAENWQAQLQELLEQHEAGSPLPHIRKFELVQGDATKTLPAYLEKHPETLISLAYFDFDIYQPTKDCLERIIAHLPKGAIVAFDELNHHLFPGETIAVNEVLGIRNLRLERDPNNPYVSWFRC